MNPSSQTARIIHERFTTEIDPNGFGQSYRVVMLGTARAGKTAYMTTMLYPLLQGQRGLQARMQDEGQRNEIVDMYEKLRKEDEFPGTARIRTWRFDLWHQSLFGSTSLFPIEWIDYRGADVDYAEIGIHYPTDPIIREHFDEIVNFVANERTVAAFVFADAARFRRGKDSQVKAELAGIRIILEECLRSSSSGGQERGMHLVLLLAKTDAIALRQGLLAKKFDRTTMRETCYEVFFDVFAPFVKNYGGAVFCDVVPISSYGYSATAGPDGRIGIVPNQLRIKSYQVDVPLLMTSMHVLRHMRQNVVPQWRTRAETERKAFEERLATAKWRERGQIKGAMRDREEALRRYQKLNAAIDSVVPTIQQLVPVRYQIVPTGDRDVEMVEVVGEQG